VDNPSGYNINKALAVCKGFVFYILRAYSRKPASYQLFAPSIVLVCCVHSIAMLRTYADLLRGCGGLLWS